MECKQIGSIVVFVIALACAFQTSLAAVSDTACTGTPQTCSIANAGCDANGKCQCNMYYKDSGTNTCMQILGSTCTTDVDCSGLANSGCTGATGSKTCTCKDGYKAEGMACVNGSVLCQPSFVLLMIAMIFGFLGIYK